MNRYQYLMVEELSKLNDEIISDKNAEFEIVSDFTKISGSNTINKILEKVICATCEDEVINLFSNYDISFDYNEILKDVFIKIFRGISFTVEEYVTFKQKA